MEVIRNVDNEFMITAHHQNDVWFFFHTNILTLVRVLSLNRQHHSSFAHVMLCMYGGPHLHCGAWKLSSRGDTQVRGSNPQQCGKSTCACGVFSCSVLSCFMLVNQIRSKNSSSPNQLGPLIVDQYGKYWNTTYIVIMKQVCCWSRTLFTQS